MNSVSLSLLHRVLVVGLLLAILNGCGGSQPAGGQSSDTAKLRAMQSLYQQFMSQHNEQPPRDEQEFRDFINTKQDQLQKAGLTVDQVFVSPRGGPMNWNYGTNPAGGQRGSTYFAYESEPTDGKRLVIAARGVSEMDETQFREAIPGAP
jgi:hypothetical protein